MALLRFNIIHHKLNNEVKMNSNEIAILESIINSSLDQAEDHWRNDGYKLAMDVKKKRNFDSKEFSINESLMPGLPPIYEGKTVIGEFIAFVADMRDSTNHLLQEISIKKAAVTRLERVFYETSALLPALAKVINFSNGKTTEYLGDGVLAFFLVNPENKAESMYQAKRAASDVIQILRPMINKILEKRYNLPEIDLGVGLAMSKAIVTLVGLPEERQVKAFGECVFRATKMSAGRNEICVDERLYAEWPSSKGGKLSFQYKEFGKGDKKFSGYLISQGGK
ncbi:hypothetical protein C7427_1256 [Pantoea ananatis]|nr:hypothetical protein C7427_1256 [Pantoea ananatis]